MVQYWFVRIFPIKNSQLADEILFCIDVSAGHIQKTVSSIAISNFYNSLYSVFSLGSFGVGAPTASASNPKPFNVAMGVAYIL